MEENSTPKVQEQNSFVKVSELAQEVGKDVKMVGRLDPTFVAKSMQNATKANLDFRNAILEGLGEETAIDPVDAAQRLEVVYLKRLDKSGTKYTVKADFKLKTPFWVYLKNTFESI